MSIKSYTTEREGQIEFFENYGINWRENDEILVNNTDGIFNGNIMEFKLVINNINKVLFQVVKYLSRLRVKGESVPATILLVDLNNQIAYQYKSIDYKDAIQKFYVGAASKDNEGFIAGVPCNKYNYSDMMDSNNLKKVLKSAKVTSEMYMPIDIDEDCIVGWAERYYRELPNASKGDFLGDETGVSVKLTGEIRVPRHFYGLINPYTGKTNERFKYLMDCLNDKLSKKDLGAFYTPEPYCKKAAELVQMAVDRVPEGNDYVIIDRCAGTGNLEAALVGIKDKQGDDLISHCVVSTYEYYEYKVLNERLGGLVRDIIPPTEADVQYENGKVSNADAMSEEFINNKMIKEYIDNEKCTIILFENPPYRDAGASDSTNTNGFKNYVNSEMCKEKLSNKTVAYDLANMFIWSGYKYYLRQETDSYVLFSPIKYWKIHGLSAKEYLKGYAFNRNYFHATSSAVFCILWGNKPNTNDSITVEVVDIKDGECITVKEQPSIECKKVEKMSNKYFPPTSSFTGEKGIICGTDGYETIKQSRGTPLYNKKYFAYLRINGFGLDAMNRNLTTVMIYAAMGRYLTQDNYLSLLPLFCAKLFPEDAWYCRDVYTTTADGGDAYTKDKDLLKSCLIYTCLSNQNKCLTFKGSDGRHYQNELCFDDGVLAKKEIDNMSLDEEEKALMDLWYVILSEAKGTANYNKGWTYGVYQISKELNTSRDVFVGNKKTIVYDYPKLNGDLDTLRVMLKAYYKSHITEKMFKYELIK